MKGFTREWILRTFGEKEANRVFPQDMKKKLPDLNEKISAEMAMIAARLIKEKGCTTEKEIIEHVSLQFKGLYDSTPKT